MTEIAVSVAHQWPLKHVADRWCPTDALKGGGSVHIHLLGLPRLDVAGVPIPSPRGRKAWALLAVLLLSERPASRRTLAQLLFPDADDPLAGLRR